LYRKKGADTLFFAFSTAYVVSEGLGLEAGVSKSFREAPVFHGLYLGIIVIGAFVIMIPNAPLLSILYFSQAVNGVLLPIVLIFMLVIINDKSVMGEHVNSRIYNYITWATAIIMIGLSAGLIAATFL
jgi:Mn2+/Fe2+ NRAMP family transporter